MPRQARLDAPETLHHVMVRGIERTAIFRDDADRADFVGRLATLAERGALTVYAWALLPNHAHLLVRTGLRPLARSMRSFLTPPCGGPPTAATAGWATSSRTDSRTHRRRVRAGPSSPPAPKDSMPQGGPLDRSRDAKVTWGHPANGSRSGGVNLGAMAT